MNHNITLDGKTCRLRPITIDDAEFIVNVRNLPHTQGKIGNIPLDVEREKKWIKGYFDDASAYCWIIQSKLNNNTDIGTYSLYNIKDGEGELGHWVQQPGWIIDIVEVFHLTMRFAFETLCLNRLYARVISTNQKVIRFEKKHLGFEQYETIPNAVNINGAFSDYICLEYTLEKWTVNSVEKPEGKKCHSFR